MITIQDITPDYLRENNINPDGLLFGPNFYPYNPKLKDFSRDMRSYGQHSEALLWKGLRGKNAGYSFSRQKPILNYIADFFCKELRLVVEIDGAAHFSAEAQDYDKERDRQLKVLGIRTIRVSDGDVVKNPDAVINWLIDRFHEMDDDAQSVSLTPP